MIPGGAPAARAFSGLILGVLGTTAVVATGFHGQMESLISDGFHKYFGLKSLPSEAFSPDRTWLWIALAIAVLMHLATVAWDFRRGTFDRYPDGPTD